MKISPFKKDFLTLSFGNGVSQAITLFFLPILTRLYNPEQVGQYALFLAAIGVLVVVSTLRYEYAVILSKTESEVNSLILVIIISSLAFAVIFSGIMVVGYSFSIDFFYQNNRSLWLLLVSVLALGAVNTIYNLLIHAGSIKYLSQLKIFQSVVAVGSQLYFSVYGGYINGLMLGYLVSCVAVICITLLSSNIINFQSLRKIDKLEINNSCKKFKDFAIFDTSNALVFNLYSSSIVFVMGVYFNLTALGFYALSERILARPVSIFVTSFTNVFYKRLAVLSQQNHDNLSNILVEASNKICLYVTLPFFLLVATSKYYVPIIFGSNWGEAHLFLYGISLLVYTRLTVSPFSNVLKVLNMQRLSFKLNVILCLGTFSALLVAVDVLNLSALTAIIVFGVSSSIILVTNVAIICKLARLRFPLLLGVFNALAVIIVVFMLELLDGI